MKVPNLIVPGNGSEEAFRERLIRANEELRIFRDRHDLEEATTDIWDRFYQMRATAVWLEDSLLSMQRARERSSRKKKRTKKRSVWERAEGGAWDE